MLSRQEIKNITALHHKKFRQLEKTFIAEGDKIVRDAIQASIKITQIYFTAENSEEIQTIARSHGIDSLEVSESEMKKISCLSSPPGVLAICRQHESDLKMTALKGKLSIVLDDIRDPGNLGTIIRIADWFGISYVICSSQTAECYNPKVVQAAMGSLFRVKVEYIDLDVLFSMNRENAFIPVYAAMLGGESVYDSELNSEALLMIGNESAGIGTQLMKFIDRKIMIPEFSIAENGKPDSLNASVATGIICSEFRRRFR
ncbi:MAG: RNA methyltransferase [Bacteroidetes bacterium]|nr:MAG: RNA methyltransferase [Bacteroidota bacterium]REK08153.1 MAG: RNA methyltransferase [Bacteroidota bacterium]REK32358.1 MAG: RNA methyltransferase [Bacteroidota bacterium]REK49592.1 MAG: RNA methyltransferase [Bacteroidota bacterium]